jgi:hypothetical protein
MRQAPFTPHRWKSDYWILNLVDRILEVYRDPAPDPSARYGWSYASGRTYPAGDVVAPLALPSMRLAVSDLLPRSTPNHPER